LVPNVTLYGWRLTRLFGLVRSIPLGRLAVVCVALTFGACATHGDLSEVRLGLGWERNTFTWTVENPSQRPIVIDNYREYFLGAPGGAWIRVTDAAGNSLTGRIESDGWYSPFHLRSSVWSPDPLVLGPATRSEHNFAAADLTTGLFVTEPIATELCRYQVRVGVASADYTRWNFLVSEWKEIDCSELRIEYCPLEGGVANCTGRPLEN
jgi:hypothetical protein